MTVNDLIDLLYTPMTDNAMIEAIETLGINLPTDADHSSEDEIETIDDNNVGIILTFREIQGFSNADGDPLLGGIEIGKHCAIELPYLIKRSDSYVEIVKKIGKPATYKDDFDDEMMIFPFVRSDGKRYAMCIAFSDEELITIRSFVIIDFNLDDDDESLVKLEG